MNNKNILICGAGIAGLTLAYWLKKFGFNPIIVEISPKLREGGYAIDFWGAGFDVAEKMGMISDLEKVDLNISEAVFVDENNKRKGGMNYRKLKKMMNGRAFTFLRSDLSKIIYSHLEKDTEIIFGDAISRIEQNQEGVTVSFHSGNIRSFNLIVGVDGLHSNVRNLVFGNETEFEKYFGYYTASYTIENGMSHNTLFLTYNTRVSRQRFIELMKIEQQRFLFSLHHKKLSYSHHDIEKQKEILKAEYENAGWKCAELLSKIDTAPNFYFDVVSRIQMNRWSKNRVTLVGDACDCPSLLSGQGSTLAMIGAYILAGELKEADGNYKRAFE